MKWGHEYFEDNRARLRENVRAAATFGTKTIGVRAFDRLAASFRDVLSERHTNPTARRGFDQRLKALARDFENDEDTIKRTEAFKHKLLTAPEATTFFAHTWEECKRALVRILRGTPTQDPALARDVAKLLDRLGIGCGRTRSAARGSPNGCKQRGPLWWSASGPTGAPRSGKRSGGGRNTRRPLVSSWTAAETCRACG